MWRGVRKTEQCLSQSSLQEVWDDPREGELGLSFPLQELLSEGLHTVEAGDGYVCVSIHSCVCVRVRTRACARPHTHEHPRRMHIHASICGYQHVRQCL